MTIKTELLELVEQERLDKREMAISTIILYAFMAFMGIYSLYHMESAADRVTAELEVAK